MEKTFVTAAAVGLACGVAGYFAGLGSTLNFSRASLYEDDSDSDVDISQFDENMKSIFTRGPCKMMLCVRTDLNMTKGKVAAQSAHAAIACYKHLSTVNPGLISHWERTGQTKIAVKVKSQDDMELLQAQALSLGLCAQVIRDAGHTQVDPGSKTVLGIGPGPVHLVDQVTKTLPLL